MCGRFTLTIPSYEDLAAALGVDPAPGAADLFRPRYNIAPTDSTWVVRLGAERQRELALLEWGLVPRWSKTLMQAGRPINARAETLEKKPVFRESLERRRCVVASDGFFEWDKSGPVKQPLWFRPANGGLLLLGGLWDSWRAEGVRIVPSYLHVRHDGAQPGGGAGPRSDAARPRRTRRRYLARCPAARRADGDPRLDPDAHPIGP